MLQGDDLRSGALLSFVLGLLCEDKLYLSLIQLFPQGSNDSVCIGNLGILGGLGIIQNLVKLLKLGGNRLHLVQLGLKVRYFLAVSLHLLLLSLKELLLVEKLLKSCLVTSLGGLELDLEGRNQFRRLILLLVETTR